MASKQGLYRGAILILKQNAVGVAVTDDDAFVNTLNLVYDDAIKFVLEAGLWNYATRTVSIEASEDVEPEFGFAFAVEKPDDYAGRVVAIAANARFYPPLSAYHEDGGLSGYFWVDCDPLYLRYISNSVEYGLNLASWPATFTRAVEYELAWRVAPHLTNMSASEKEELRKDRERTMRDAKSKDALNQAPERPPPGRLVTARAGRMARRDWWRQ